MLLATKIRLAGIGLNLFVFSCWLYTSKIVLKDYQSLLNHEDEVRLSLITLWVPVGGLSVILALLFLSPKAIFYGKKVNELFSEKTIKLANQACIFGALLGVVFAVIFTFYCMNLLSEYGYRYSYKLTEITPTGIHLMYVKPPR